VIFVCFCAYFHSDIRTTLWAVASWLIFYVAPSLRIDSDMLVVTASPARTALKNQSTDPAAAGRDTSYL
jgi:hypothetical protein